MFGYKYNGTLFGDLYIRIVNSRLTLHRINVRNETSRSCIYRGTGIFYLNGSTGGRLGHRDAGKFNKLAIGRCRQN